MIASRALATTLISALMVAACWSAPAPDAQTILNQSLRLAAKQHKNVFVDFGASWCPWCRKLEGLLDKSKLSAAFRRSYVICHITVRERAEKADLENKGWETIMKRFRRVADQDIPYVVILSPTGQFLGDSYEKTGEKIPDNAGYPQTPEEISGYLTLIRTTGPGFSPADLTTLRAYFTDPTANPR